MATLLVTIAAPGQVVPEWWRYGVAVVTDIPLDGVPGGATLVLVDPQCVVKQ
jgi:hypothetical protein